VAAIRDPYQADEGWWCAPAELFRARFMEVVDGETMLAVDVRGRVPGSRKPKTHEIVKKGAAGLVSSSLTGPNRLAVDHHGGRGQPRTDEGIGRLVGGSRWPGPDTAPSDSCEAGQSGC